MIAWEKARALTVAIYRETATGPFSKDYGLHDQIRKASVSVMSNIAEGYERSTPSEFSQFLSFSKASCAELRSQLYVALDVNYLNQEEFQILMEQAEEVAKIIGALKVSVRKKIKH